MEETIKKYFKRVDTSQVAPWFLVKCAKLVENCKAKGVEYYAISAYRDPQEQEKMYAIGRTIELEKKPITNARPWTSYHNYGFAIDFCRDANIAVEGLQPSWKLEDYQLLADEAHKLGLTAGLDFNTFKEGPHIQVPFRTGATGELKKLWLEKGREFVWQYGLDNLKKTIDFGRYYKE